MSITFSCGCGRNVVIGEEYAGQEGKCPGCGRLMTIPRKEERFADRPGMVAASTAEVEKRVPIWEQTPASRRPPPLPEDGIDSEPELAPLVTHANAPVQEDDDFFAEAPREIGRLFSVFTSLKKHQAPMPSGTRMGIAAAAFVAGCIVCAIVGAIVTGGRLRPSAMVFSLGASAVVGLLFVAIAYWLTGFSHRCSFVGDDGLASFQCSGHRGSVTETGFFLFKDAANLRIAQTRQYVNGAYTGTNYSYTWSDDRGNTVFTLSGRYSSEAGTPLVTDPYYFALAAEAAWSLYLFRNMDRLMTRDKTLYFSLTGGSYIEIGEGVLMLYLNGTAVELHADRIHKVTIENGVVSIWEFGAQKGWFSNSGIHQFSYADLGNARFFLFAVEKLLGIRF